MICEHLALCIPVTIPNDSTVYSAAPYTRLNLIGRTESGNVCIMAIHNADLLQPALFFCAGPLLGIAAQPILYCQNHYGWFGALVAALWQSLQCS